MCCWKNISFISCDVSHGERHDDNKTKNTQNLKIVHNQALISNYNLLVLVQTLQTNFKIEKPFDQPFLCAKHYFHYFRR